MMNDILTAGLADWNLTADDSQLAGLNDFFVRVVETNLNIVSLIPGQKLFGV